MITSFSRRVTVSWKHVVLTANGQKVVVSTITTKKHSSFGLMRKISSVLFQCSLVLILVQYLSVWAELVQLSKTLLNLLSHKTLVTWPHALLTLELPFVQVYTSTCLIWVKKKTNSKQSQTDSTFKSVVLMVNIPKQTITFMTSQIKEDSVDLKSLSYKICTMVSRQWLPKKKN